MAPVYATLLFLVVTFGNLFGKIVNGYEPQLPATIEALYNLNSLLSRSADLEDEQERRLRLKMKSSEDFVVGYELTRELIDRLRSISPDIYHEMDGLKDKRGRPTDVYVRLIPWQEPKLHHAASFFSAAAIDADASVSIYGDFSVTINIWRTDNALILLCHELGHVRYIVPNLAEYCKFYNRNYINPHFDLNLIGHHYKDLSGKSAKQFEKRFLNDRSAWRKQSANTQEPFHTLAVRIRRLIRKTDISDVYPGLARPVASKKKNLRAEPGR